jgi:hypothetical protein
MKLLGGRDRKWLPISGYEDFDLARARELSQWMIEDDSFSIVSELKNIFFISGYHAEFGGGIQFIKTGENSLDSFVYCIDMACYDDVNWLDTTEIYSKSIWGWIDNYLSMAQKTLNIKPKVAAEVNKSFWQKLFGN